MHGHPNIKSLAVFWMLYAFFWVIPRRLNFICRRFGILFHHHRQVGLCRILHGWNIIIGISAGELPRRKHTTKIAQYSGHEVKEKTRMTSEHRKIAVKDWRT
jgi:hypothetical protein